MKQYEDMKKNGVLLIHGAGLGSFIWDELIPLLNLPALAVDFPNRKKGDKVNLQLSFKHYSDAVIQQVEQWNIESFVIVAHSVGGCVGLKVAEHFGKRVIGFVGISSVIPSDGNSFISCLPFPQKVIMPVILKIAGTKPPKKAIEIGLCHDLTDMQCQSIMENFTPESKALFKEKCKAEIPNVKKLYIKLLNDQEFPTSMQEKMAENMNTQNIATIESGHLPMLSHTNELAKILNDFC
ncbi:alpha/beta hydrolase [Marivirga sp. S37H4]|uniref:Alpha/beta hydrolase n=1 Tax=Marivirga aurantiaca TaxID=2802615 RepID=A0A935C7F4_9BACT|nr:alpha/beta hydrolase [Marivirga aurantiaca]MBK6264895.1 alpha/beta hydrolase [Marivirga aurantiaca]